MYSISRLIGGHNKRLNVLNLKLEMFDRFSFVYFSFLSLSLSLAIELCYFVIEISLHHVSMCGLCWFPIQRRRIFVIESSLM